MTEWHATASPENMSCVSHAGCGGITMPMGAVSKPPRDTENLCTAAREPALSGPAAVMRRNFVRDRIFRNPSKFPRHDSSLS